MPSDPGMSELPQTTLTLTRKPYRTSTVTLPQKSGAWGPQEGKGLAQIHEATQGRAWGLDPPLLSPLVQKVPGRSSVLG